MNTLYDLGQEVLKIREAIEMIEVHGRNNAHLVMYAYDKCNDIIEAINSIAQEANGAEEEGDTHGEQDSGTSESD